MSGSFVMITGILHATPIERMSKSGHSVMCFKVKIPRGQNSEWWMCSAFSQSAREELADFAAGDAVCCVGSLTLGLYEFEGQTKINREIAVSRILGIKTPDKVRRDRVKADLREEIRSDDSNESDETGGLPDFIARSTK